MKHEIDGVTNITLKWRLPHIKTLNMLKMEKNFIAHIEKKYSRQPYLEYKNIAFWIMRLAEESQELIRAFKDDDIQTMKEECADISNIIDYLFEVLIRKGE